MKSSEPPPLEVAGTLLDEFETGTFGHKFAAVFVPLLAVSALGGWVYGSIKAGFALSSGYIVMTVMLLGLFGLCLYGSIWAIAAFRWRLRLYENGLLFCEGPSARWIPWKDVARYKEIQVIMNGVSTGYRLYIFPRQSKRIPVDGFFKDNAAAAGRIKDYMIPGMIHEAQASLDRGQGVDFKVLAVQPDGLRIGKQFVAWKDLGRVAVEGNRNTHFNVVVRVAGRKRPVLQTPATSFPSLDVFFALLKKYRPTELASAETADLQPGG